MRAWLQAGVVGLVLAAAGPAGGDPPEVRWPHERAATAGAHPRLLVGADEVESLRAKVNAPGTLSNFLWERALAAAPRTAGVPDFWTALHATAPFAALLAATAEERAAWTRVALDSALAVVRAFEPPYPEPEEWYARFLYRYLALAYDAAYGAMTDAERAEFQDEMQRICAAIGGPERSANNHSLVFAVGLGLLAMALDGDVPSVPREVADEALVRGGGTPAGDWLRHRSGVAVTRVGDRPGASDYEVGRDYALKWFRDEKNPHQQGFGLVWQQGGKAPAPGAAYYATYRFLPDTAEWKDTARAAVQRNLDAVWCDGASTAGVMYGGWTLHWCVDAVEAMRRNLGVDFARHPAARDFVRWLPYELIAADEPFLRVHNRNDSGYGQADEKTRFGAPLAWASTRFRGDEGKRDLGAAWLLSRSTAWIRWAGPREALWARDDLLGPPPFRAPARLDLPLSAFFRGHGLSCFRTGAWDGPPDDWALLSLVGGPFMGPEHDQTDKGSFAFYACGEDWAVDSGYAQGDARSDATAAHNYLLIDGKGQPGPWGTTAFARTRFLGEAFDATQVDLRRSWLNANAWGPPKDEKPSMWPVRSADRWGVLLKGPGGPPVALVADSVDKDGSPHAYEWLLHTQAGNTVAVEGASASIAGARGKGRCAVRLAALGPLALRTEIASGVEMAAHTRLVARTEAANPGFLALLVPEKAGGGAPRGVETASGSGWLGATVVWAGAKDLVVFSPARAPAKALGIESDAALAVVREGPDGAAVAWLAFDATSLKHRGRVLWAADKPKGARGSACFDGTRLLVAPSEVLQFRAAARAAEFEKDGVLLRGALAGGLLAWAGRRPLRDAFPAGTPALAEDFESGCAPWFVQWPLSRPRWVRCVDGELCLPGLKRDWVSWTRRAFTPFRADVVLWPRTIYEDFVLRGEVTFVEGKPGAPWRLQARVADRSFPDDWLPPDQDLLQVELEPAKGEAVLSSRVGGRVVTLASGKVGAVPWGKTTAFELSVQGASVRFSLGGAPKLKATAKGEQMPPAGYFQWEQAEGLHAHLDNLRVSVDP